MYDVSVYSVSLFTYSILKNTAVSCFFPPGDGMLHFLGSMSAGVSMLWYPARSNVLEEKDVESFESSLQYVL